VTVWLGEQLLILADVMLPPLPGSTIGPVETEPPSVTSHLNSEIKNPLKPSPLIVAVMLPPGLAVTVAALATAAEAATSAAAINSDVSVLRMKFPLASALAMAQASTPSHHILGERARSGQPGGRQCARAAEGLTQN
jgi:hypothetical protein